MTIPTNPMTYFDRLPLEDVIHETIIPMLDYESRIQFNQILLPFERLNRRLAQKDILQHEIKAQTDLVKSQLNYIGSSKNTKLKRCQRMCSMINNLRAGKRGYILPCYLDGMRKAMIDKFLEFQDPNNNCIQTVSPYFKRKIRLLAQEVMPDILSIEKKNIVLNPRAIRIEGF